MSASPSALSERAEGAALELTAWDPPAGADPLFEVLATSLAAWDLRARPPVWPRIAGGTIATRDESGARWLCGGFLPCGRCAPCRSALQLACEQPVRPGWNAPGGLASLLRLPPGQAPADLAADVLPATVALVAAAGLTYQARALAGMVPGDTVLVVGDAGPGALPLRLLVAEGLRPVWLGGSRPVPEGALCASDPPPPGELPSARCHLIDLSPAPSSVARWSAVAASCLSVSLLGPVEGELRADLATVLGGQVSLRRVRDLHPHLVLDLAAMIASRRLLVDDVVEVIPRTEAASALEALRAGTSQRWPVVV